MLCMLLLIYISREPPTPKQPKEMPEIQLYCDLLSILSYSTTHQNVPMVIGDHQLGGFVVAGVEEGVAVGGEGGVGQLVGCRF